MNHNIQKQKTHRKKDPAIAGGYFCLNFISPSISVPLLLYYICIYTIGIQCIPDWFVNFPV